MRHNHTTTTTTITSEMITLLTVSSIVANLSAIRLENGREMDGVGIDVSLAKPPTKKKKEQKLMRQVSNAILLSRFSQILIISNPIPVLVWVLQIAKVGYFFSPSLPNREWLILEPLPSFFL